MEIEKKDILIIISLFSAALLIRVANVSNPNLLMKDEMIYWSIAISILANNFAPTSEISGYPSPFLPHIMALIIPFFGGDLNTLRIISVVFGSLTVPMLYLFGKAMYDRKTGLLSALFLCFSAYHCLYSRIFKLEAFTLFFVTAFLYFFWMTQCSEDRKSMTYAIIAGAMMGLAIAAKYLPAFLFPAVLIYAFWTGRFSFKALMDKRIMLTLVFALLFFSPMLLWWYYADLGLDPIFSAIWKYEKMPRTGEIWLPQYRVIEHPLSEIFARGMWKITEMFSWGAKILIPPWRISFELSAFLLLPITLFSYLPNFINREKKASFLMIFFLSLIIFLLPFSPCQYYLIYSFPFYFVMLSHLAVKSFEYLWKENSRKNILRVFIILLTTVMLFSSSFTSVTSPYWEDSDFRWLKDSIDYIKSDATRVCDGDIVIGCTIPRDVAEYHVPDYYIYLSGLNATTIPILKHVGRYEIRIELRDISKLKPDYILMTERMHDYLFYETSQMDIFDDYNIVFHSEYYYFPGGFVFKRKDMQPPESPPPMNGESGKISRDIFSRSIPSVMDVGKVYTALVKVKNTGDSNADFIVKVYSEKFIIFVEEGSGRTINLDKGSSRVLKFKIVPIKEYTGKLPIIVDLYAKHGGANRKVDSFIDYIYLIKR